MKEQEAYAVLIRKDPGWLQKPIEELVKMSAVGSVYLEQHKKLLQKIKSGQIELAEEDRKRQLEQGQILADALLDAEVRIGELLPSREDIRRASTGGSRSAPTIDSLGRKNYGGGGKKVLPPGIDSRRSKAARKLAENPAIVEAIKKEARKNEDLPTKTAVLNRIKYEKEKERKDKVQHQTSDRINRLEEANYIVALERVINLLPPEPPRECSQAFIEKASKYAAVIIRRLRPFAENDTNIRKIIGA